MHNSGAVHIKLIENKWKSRLTAMHAVAAGPTEADAWYVLSQVSPTFRFFAVFPTVAEIKLKQNDLLAVRLKLCFSFISVSFPMCGHMVQLPL